MKKIVGALALASIMIGCGSDSTTITKIGTGTYVDSAVSGVVYKCGNQSGTTDAAGTFKFDINKGCRFLVNDIQFRTVSNDNLADGVVIQEKNINIARFLQTLDNDGNAENGITISEEVSKKVIKVPVSDVDFQVLDNTLKGMLSYAGKAISEEDAKAHLMDRGVVFLSAKATVTPTTSTQDDTVTFDASESTGAVSYVWREGRQQLSTAQSFSKSNFTIGNHTIVLTAKDADGNEEKATIMITVKQAAAPTIWDDISPVVHNGDKLFVTSDDTNLYIKLESEKVEDALFYINSDNSRRSGLNMNIFPNDGFDFVLKSDGLHALQHNADYDGELVQDMSHSVENGATIIALDKTHFANLAEDITIGVFFTPTNFMLNNFKDTHYVLTADQVAPIITVSSQFIGVTDANYTKPTATAFDIFDDAIVTVMSDDSDVDTTRAGYYTVVHTATDIAGNIAKASTIVQVQGQSTQTALELKSMGAFDDDVAINHQTGLVWSNDNRNEATTKGCIIFGEHQGATNIQSGFENFCVNSKYAGFTDWETPTVLELSKFNVQMAQEGIEPGMARKNCSRIIAIDGDVVSAVWTHRTLVNGLRNYTGYTETLSGTMTPPAGGRCVRRSKGVDTSTGTFTATRGTIGTAKVIADSSTNLMWVNEFNIYNNACLAIHKGVPAEYNASKNFCGDLNYNGKTDWRDPSSSELATYVTTTNDAHIFIGFEAPCKRLLARDANGTESAVSTRYDSTKTVGTVSTLEQNLTAGNIGLRCVRPNN